MFAVKCSTQNASPNTQKHGFVNMSLILTFEILYQRYSIANNIVYFDSFGVEYIPKKLKRS